MSFNQFNHSPVTDSKEFTKLQRKFIGESYSFLVIDTASLSDSFLHDWKDLLEEV